MEAIQKWELPKTQEELRSFLSVVGYYRRFVDGFAKLAQPLSDMLREGEFQLPFSPAAAEAFYELRRRMGALFFVCAGVRLHGMSRSSPGRDVGTTRRRPRARRFRSLYNSAVGG